MNSKKRKKIGNSAFKPINFGTAASGSEGREAEYRQNGHRVIGDQVFDEQGRKRFHGAFTGGFSAGYFNSVGSKEGWAPQQFRSERQRKTEISQNVADFMDDEDFEAIAAEANKDALFQSSGKQQKDPELLYINRQQVDAALAKVNSMFKVKVDPLPEYRPLDDYRGLGFVSEQNQTRDKVHKLRQTLRPNTGSTSKLTMKAKFNAHYKDDYVTFDGDEDDLFETETTSPKTDYPQLQLESAVSTLDDLFGKPVLVDFKDHNTKLAEIPADFKAAYAKPLETTAQATLEKSEALKDKAKLLLRISYSPAEYKNDKLSRFKQFLLLCSTKQFSTTHQSAQREIRSLLYPSVEAAVANDEINEFSLVLLRYKQPDAAISNRFVSSSGLTTNSSLPVAESRSENKPLIKRTVEEWVPEPLLLKRLFSK